METESLVIGLLLGVLATLYWIYVEPKRKKRKAEQE